MNRIINLKRKKLTAFSLLELIVVIAIVAVILGMGTTALISLRNQTLVRQSLNEFVENYKETRNIARNSVISGIDRDNVTDDDIAELIKTLDYRVIGISDDTYSLGTCQCQEEIDQQLDYDQSQCLSTTTGSVVCDFPEGSLKSNIYSVVEVTPGDPQACSAIIFGLGTASITFGIDDDLGGITATESDTCTVQFTHSQTRWVNFNLTIDRQTSEITIE
jgi:prepilin-type N-terminal cleavage/methylation domain-containing protein